MSLLDRLEDGRAPQLELLRVGLGAALLLDLGPLASHLVDFYGDAGWVSPSAFRTLSLDRGWPSLLAPVHDPGALLLVHLLFCAAALAFTLGFWVRWIKWPLWVMYLSFLNRDPAIVYGVDLLIASLLLPVCVAPVGRWLTLGRPSAGPPTGPRAAVCLALVRWQMALIYFFAAAQKLRGGLWWSGEALWVALHNTEFANFSVDRLAGAFWLVNLATHGALLLELAYPFLVWGRRTRPWMLLGAVVLHLGIAALMGLYLFSLVAIAGQLAFLDRRWLEAAALSGRRRWGPRLAAAVIPRRRAPAGGR